MFNIKDHTASKEDVEAALFSVTSNESFKFPATSTGILALQFLVQQELAKSEKCVPFRLVYDKNSTSLVSIIHGNPADYGWEDFTSFEHNGKNYVMFPDPFDTREEFK